MGWGFEDGSCPRRLCSSGSIIDWLVVWQEALQKIRQKNTMRREVTVELSSQGFWKTGIRSDVCQVTPLNCMHAHTAPIPWNKHTNVHIVSQHNALVLLKVKRFKTSFNALQRDKYKQSFKTKIYIYIFLTRHNRILNKDYFNYRLFFFFF